MVLRRGMEGLKMGLRFRWVCGTAPSLDIEGSHFELSFVNFGVL